MSKPRRRSDDDDDLDFGRERSPQCTSIDHCYPQNAPGGKTLPETRCYCGKKQFRPFIDLNDYLQEGMIIQMNDGGHLYRVEMVNESRARCRRTSAKAELLRIAEEDAPQFMPLPGMDRVGTITRAELDTVDGEDRGHVINVSSRSVTRRLSREDLVQLLQPEDRREVMAKGKFAALPGGNGKSRPLTGAAAKAKANAKPKAPKTVRKCGCGCGGDTTAFFVPGHDARYKGWMKKLADGKIDQAELKKLMGQKTYGLYNFKKKGAGFVPDKTYQQAAGVE